MLQQTGDPSAPAMGPAGTACTQSGPAMGPLHYMQLCDSLLLLRCLICLLHCYRNSHATCAMILRGVAED